MKRRLLAALLLLAYLLSGCKADKKETSTADKDEMYKNYYDSLMENYMAYGFIKDFGFYNEEHPEYYVGNNKGLLTEAFGEFTGGKISAQNYYFDLITMYDNNLYEKSENGAITFYWDKYNNKNSSIDFEITKLFSFYDGTTILEDTTKDGTKYTRKIRDDKNNF